MDVNSALFIAGGLVVLLLFGCVGAPREKAPQPPVPPAPPEDAGSGLGDADVSSPEAEANGDILPEEDLVIPPVEDEPSEETDLKIDVSDVFIDEGSDYDFISEGDIIEPL